MCRGKDHSHKGRISDVHSSLDREFYFERNKNSMRVADDDNVRQKRAELEAHPDDVGALIALGDALAYQMRYNEALEFYEKARELNPLEYIAHRKCAVRYLSVLELDRAEKELIWCAEHTDDPLDINYLRAMTAYCKGNFAFAEDILKDCYRLARDNGEMYVAVIFWHILCLVGRGSGVDGALNNYYDGLDGGHHTGYMQAVRLFKLDDINAGDIIDCDDELNKSIYLFGLYAYQKYKGDVVNAARTLDDMLRLDTYFSSFAYLGAYCEKNRSLQAAEQRLAELLSQKHALAFSGGTDSAFLLSMAKRVGGDVKAYFVRSAFQPHFEVEDAKRLADELDIPCEFIDADVLCDDDIVQNSKDRCYYCKRKIFGSILKSAKRDGYDLIADGTNASDDLEKRAGARAMRELGVCSPLRECGLTKDDVRFLSRKYGVFIWNKPSYSCLATRIRTGERITAEALKNIEKAESLMFEFGYENFRIRVKDGHAEIEISKLQNQKFQGEKSKIIEALSRYFDSVKQSDILR